MINLNIDKKALKQALKFAGTAIGLLTFCITGVLLSFHFFGKVGFAFAFPLALFVMLSAIIYFIEKSDFD